VRLRPIQGISELIVVETSPRLLVPVLTTSDPGRSVGSGSSASRPNSASLRVNVPCTVSSAATSCWLTRSRELSTPASQVRSYERSSWLPRPNAVGRYTRVSASSWSSAANV